MDGRISTMRPSVMVSNGLRPQLPKWKVWVCSVKFWKVMDPTAILPFLITQKTSTFYLLLYWCTALIFCNILIVNLPLISLSGHLMMISNRIFWWCVLEWGKFMHSFICCFFVYLKTLWADKSFYTIKWSMLCFCLRFFLSYVE